MNPEDENTWLGHLEALRHSLLYCLVGTAVLLPLAYLLAPTLLVWMVSWTLPPELGKLHFFSPLEAFLVRVKMSVIMALLAAYPWNLTHLWRFLAPALYEREKKLLLRAVLVATLLFLAGLLFAILIVLPILMRFAGQFATAQLQPMLGLAAFFELSCWLSLAFGLVFQTPALVVPAVRLGLISSNELRRQRPLIMTVILVVAAFLTPPDVLSQLLLAIPAWFMFEAGLFWATKAERKMSPIRAEDNSG